MIPWQKYLDRIYCIHYLPHKGRLEWLLSELQRVGIAESGIFEWHYTFPSRWEQELHNIAYRRRWVRELGHTSLTLANYAIFKKALLLGYERILILENDVAFLKDEAAIKHILECIPYEYGMIQLDKLVFPKRAEFYRREKTERPINDCFFEAHYGYPFSDCNVWTKSGMEKAVEFLDNRLIESDLITRYWGLPYAVAIRNMAVQIAYQDSSNVLRAPPGYWMRLYKISQQSLVDYNLPEWLIRKCGLEERKE